MGKKYLEVVNELENLIKSYSYNCDEYSVEFNMVKTKPANYTDSTVTTPVTVAVTVTSNITGSKLTKHLNILDVPVDTAMGYKLNGTYYSMMSIDRRAPGWYISDQRIDNGRILSLEFIPESGMHILCFCNNDELIVRVGTGKNSVNLGIFLKALTGRSFSELALKLGYRNRLVTTTLCHEVDRDECIENVLALFNPNYSKIPKHYRYNEVMKRFYNKNYMKPGNIKERIESNIAFSNRALYCDLAEDLNLKVEGKEVKIERGKNLNEEDLSYIDRSGLDTLLVIKEGKLHELKKYNIHESPSLCEEELFTVFNMIIVAANGLSYSDSIYDLPNRKIWDYKDCVVDEVSKKLVKILDSVFNLCSTQEIDLRQLDFGFIEESRDSLISMFKTKLKENGRQDKTAQTADTTNFVAMKSEETKIISDMNGRTTGDSISVKDSQLSLIDPYHQPENKKVGLTSYKTLTSRSTSEGLVGKFVKINNGNKVSDDVVELTPQQIVQSIIAPWDEDLSKKKIKAYKNGMLITVPVKDVEYQQYSCYDNLSYSTSLMTFIGNSGGKRDTLSAGQTKQARVTLKTSRPRVSTGSTGIFFKEDLKTARSILAEHYILNNSRFLAIGIEYDDFIKNTIKLIKSNTEEIGFCKLLFTIVNNNDLINEDIEVTIDYCSRNSSDSVYQYNINSVPDFEYKDEMIVAYPNSLDIKKYNLDYFVNTGNMKVDKKDFNIDLALGNDYLIAFSTYSSCNMDDGITINGGLLGTGKMSHVLLKEITAELKTYDEGEKEEFGFDVPKPNYESNGLPKIGTRLKPKDVVIGKKLKTTSGVIAKNVTLDLVTEGVVLSASIERGKARVQIATIVEVELGDKFTGDHGNKGVIAKIVPESNMPYMPGGRVIDILLNPLGVPSRMNISQIIHAVFGMCLEKENKYAVLTPMYQNSTDIVREYAKRDDVKPIRLIDGRTNLLFDRPCTVGVLNFKRLSHEVTSKYNSLGLSNRANPVTGQPNKGEGQTLGEMELHTLMGMGMYKTIQEFMSIQSDDILARPYIENYMKDPQNNKVPTKNNNNDLNIQALFTGLGVKLINSEETKSGLELLPMKDTDITKLAIKPTDSIPGSLHNGAIFGYTNSNVGALDAKTRFGFIDLKCGIVNPLFLNKGKVPKLIIVLAEDRFGDFEEKPLTASAVKDVIQGNKSFYFSGNSIYLYKTKKDSSKVYDTGVQAIVKAFQISSFEKARGFYEGRINDSIENNVNGKKNKEIFSDKEMISLIDYYEEKGIDLNDFIIHYFPILPQNFRLVIGNRSSDLDMYYSQLLYSINKWSDEDRRVNEVYKKIENLVGLGVEMEKNSVKIKNIKSYFTGKEGFLRSKVVRKKLYQSCRGVIIPAEAGLLKINQIGLPYRMAVDMLSGFIKPALVKEFRELESKDYSDPLYMDSIILAIMNNDIEYIASQIVGIPEDTMAKIRDIIEKIVSRKAILFGRQPTLHRFGARAFEIVLVDGKAIRLHQLVCAGFNADFDGDQMYGIIPITDEVVMEILDKASPEVDMINPRDNKLILEPNQDTLIGSYLATMLHGNSTLVEYDLGYETPNLKDLKVYDSIENVESDLRTGILKIHELAIYRHSNGFDYVSTAERIVYNSTVTNGFSDFEYRNPFKLDLDNSAYNFKKLRYDGYSIEDVVFYDSLDLLKSDTKYRKTMYQDLVCYTDPKGNRYLSTAGRILFNSLLPNGLTDESYKNSLNLSFMKNQENFFKELKYDGLVKNGKLELNNLKSFKMSKICRQVYDDFGSVITCKVLNEIFKFGTDICDRSGFTLSLDDFIEYPGLDDLLEKADKVIVKVYALSELGLMDEEGRKNTSKRIYQHIFSHVEKTLLDYYTRNNNMFIIMESGARGNISHLMQSCGLIGYVEKNNKEKLETPILSNYTRGLSSSDHFKLSFGTRTGFIAVHQETPKSGEATRNAVYNLENLKIVEHDCGSGMRDFDVLYTEDMYSCIDSTTGKLCNINDHINELIDKSDDNYDKYSYLKTDDRLTLDVIYYIKKNHITRLKLKDKELIMRYRLHPLFKDMMMYRISTGLKHLVDLSGKLEKSKSFTDTEDSISTEGYITEKTLNFIESEGLKSIKVRTMLTCNSIRGVCSKCYGISGDTKKLNPVGTEIGTIAAQGMGEPSAQLVISSVNNTSGGNSVQGVDGFKTYSKGQTPGGNTGADYAIVAEVTGPVKVTNSGRNLVKVKDINGVTKLIKKDNCKVIDGEYVEEGEFISSGIIRPNDIHKSETEVEIRAKQIELMKLFFSFFYDSSIDIRSRHFECLVRVQTSLVRVLFSKNDKFKEGHIYFRNELLGVDQSEVEYFHNVEPYNIVEPMYSGFITSILHESSLENLANACTSPWIGKSKNESLLSKVALGLDTSSNKIKKIDTRTYENSVGSIKDDDVIFNNSDKYTGLVQKLKTEETINIDLTAGLENLQLFDDVATEPETDKDIIENEVAISEENHVTETDKTYSTLKRSTVF